jgi:hypothetical protein
VLGISLKKRERERVKFGGNLVLGLSIRYVRDCMVLKNLLLVTKDKMIRREVYKQALKLVNEEKQHQIWKSLVFDKDTYEKYKKIKENDMESFIHFNESVNHLIDMDVYRSFYTQGEEPKQVCILITVGNKEHIKELCYL